MLNKIKNNLEYTFCAGLGLLNFILFAFPYVASYVEYDLGAWGGAYSASYGVSGYSTMSLWAGGFGGVMSSLIQLIIFLAGLGLLAWGVCGLLKEFGILPKFPEQIGSFESKKLSELALMGMAALHVLQLVFLIIFTVSNSEEAYGSSAGFRLSAGIFIALVIYAGAVAGLIFLKKKFPATKSGERVSYVCTGCGKRAKASDKFCNACGGSIEKKVTVPSEYVCEKCGAKSNAKSKFCQQCGGAIVQRQPEPAASAEQA